MQMELDFLSVGTAMALTVAGISAVAECGCRPRATAVTVYKSPTCGAAKKFVDYLRLRRTERQKETICVLSRVTLMKSA